MHTRKTLALMLALLMALSALAGGVAAAQAPAEAGPAGIGPEAALAAVSTGFTYQGRLTDAGNPAAGPYDFVFRLYDALTGGSQVGGIVTQGDVAVSNGLFTVSLDFGVVFDGAARWLEIAVRPGASNDAYAILSPRQALAATPYALHSLSTAAHDHFGETWTGATVGDGLRVENTAASGYAYGVTGQSASTSGRGVYGYASAASGTTYGVQGQSASTGGVGVHGVTNSDTGSNAGVWGLSFSTSGTGVSGQAAAATGTTFGVYGQSSSDQGYGVYGVTWANTGVTYGVYGRALSTSGYAGYFTGKGPDAVVVTNTGAGRGISVETSTDTAIWAITDAGLAAVDGRAAGATGRGLYGFATAAAGANSGVYGRTASTDGRGVYGWAEATSGTNYGVYGRTSSASGYAGYFQGNLRTTATLTKAAGSFKIDHPLDPANQYLSHSFVESPDMMNLYNGNAVLDAQGEATVILPEWFEALNQDFRYQLTPVGAAMPNLYVAQKVQDNTFRIAGGVPGMEVSWMVTGIRHDAYANAHRIPVEEQKPAEERGLYLHPTELGQPAELGLDHQRDTDQSQQNGPGIPGQAATK